MKLEYGNRLYRERRGTIGAADAHAVAVIVGNLGPTHILMVARLLRHEVRRMIRESVGAPHAELGVFAVQVVSAGPVPKNPRFVYCTGSVHSMPNAGWWAGHPALQGIRRCRFTRPSVWAV